MIWLFAPVGDRSLLDRLLAAGNITPANLQRAERLRVETGERLDVILIRLGLLSEADLAQAYAAEAAVPIADLASLPASPLLPDRLRLAFLRDARAVPLAETPDTLTVAFADPTDPEVLAALGFAAKRRIVALVATASDIERALDRLYGDGAAEAEAAPEIGGDDTVAEDAERLRDLASDAPVIRMVNRWLTAAVEAHASDIHIEPAEAALRVRFRLDGVLVERETQPLALHAAVVSRLKIMARLDIAERRLTQDGRIGIAVRGRETDIRVSIVPTVRGESVVLRILERGGVTLDFAALGFDPGSHARTRPPAAGSLVSAKPRDYIGQEQLDRTGLMNLNRRLYDSHLGRFLAADPIEHGFFANAAKLNRYAHAGSAPLCDSVATGFARAGGRQVATTGVARPTRHWYPGYGSLRMMSLFYWLENIIDCRRKSEKTTS
jgi:RHS repeat-associated protein